MIENQSPTLWQASIGNDAVLHNGTPPANTVNKRRSVSSDRLSKVVLLVDSNSRSRESRAKVLRTMGVVVHPAATAATARVRLANSRFDLVLVDLGGDVDGAESLVAEIRLNNRKQRVAFLVGKPLYVASSLQRNVVTTVAASPKLLPAAAKTAAHADFGKRIKDAEAAMNIHQD